MPLPDLLESSAGTCRFCRQQDGILSREHSQCRRTYQAGWNEMVRPAADAARSHEFHANSLRISLAEIARWSYRDASTVARALEEGWRRAVSHAAADGSITHEEEVGIANQVMLISSAVSHALAWIAYLVVTFGLVLWPAWQDGDGQDLIVLATVFAPVALSGLGLLTVLDQGRLVDINPMSSIFAVLLTLFCGLAIFSIVLIHLPVSVKLTIGLIVGFYPIILTLGVGRGGRSLLLGITMALLLGFSPIAIHSVGIFFLPAALAMLVATAASLLAKSSAPTRRKQ